MIADGRGYISPPSDDAWDMRAEITSYDMQCRVGKGKITIQTTANVGAERRKNGDSATFPMQFFMVRLNGDDVIEKKVFDESITFGSNKTERQDDVTLSMEIPVGADDTLAEQNIYFGFQLTPDQLAYLRGLRDARVAPIRNLPDMTQPITPYNVLQPN